ncbi:MAG: DUF2125 domain-containing protein [Alphaproteobacteria bacterium]|nr:DUF2125 domain-containing protein [Alphaproteobacteria bacterium]
MSGSVGLGRRRGRGLGLWILVFVLVLVAGHALYWRWATQRLEQGFLAWAADRRAHGWVVRAGEPGRGGWPLAATVSVPGLHVEGGQNDIPDGFAWDAERVRLSVRLLQPRSLSISAEGNQRLRLSDLPEIPYTADRLHADVPFEPGVPAHVADIVARDLRAGMPSGKEAASGLTIGLLQVHGEVRPAAPQGEPVLAFTTSAEAIGLPPDVRWALGSRISSLSINGALNGPLPRVPGLVHRATAWRDGGGSLAIQRLALGWGPLGLTGSATLALDMRLQPMGTGTARIVGYAETLDALAASGAITKQAAMAAKALAGLIARIPADGGRPEIEVPLTLQDRTLSIRQIPLARIPELLWPPE